MVLQIQTQGEVQTRGLILWVRLQNPEFRGKQNLCTWTRLKTGGNQKSEKPTRFSVSTLLFLPEFPSICMWCTLKLGNHSWSSVRETQARPIWTKTGPSLCSFATGFYKCFAFVIDGTDKDRGTIPWITKFGSPGKVIWGTPALGWLLYKTKLTRTSAKFLFQILYFIQTLSISLGFLRVEIPNSLGRVWNVSS